jgi:hypothetical protein
MDDCSLAVKRHLIEAFIAILRCGNAALLDELRENGGFDCILACLDGLDDVHLMTNLLRELHEMGQDLMQFVSRDEMVEALTITRMDCDSEELNELVGCFLTSLGNVTLCV